MIDIKVGDTVTKTILIPKEDYQRHGQYVDRYVPTGFLVVGVKDGVIYLVDAPDKVATLRYIEVDFLLDDYKLVYSYIPLKKQYDNMNRVRENVICDMMARQVYINDYFVSIGADVYDDRKTRYLYRRFNWHNANTESDQNDLYQCVGCDYLIAGEVFRVFYTLNENDKYDSYSRCVFDFDQFPHWVDNRIYAKNNGKWYADSGKIGIDRGKFEICDAVDEASRITTAVKNKQVAESKTFKEILDKAVFQLIHIYRRTIDPIIYPAWSLDYYRDIDKRITEVMDFEKNMTGKCDAFISFIDDDVEHLTELKHDIEDNAKAVKKSVSNEKKRLKDIKKRLETGDYNNSSMDFADDPDDNTFTFRGEIFETRTIKVPVYDEEDGENEDDDE